jgi:hypothetical protein
MPPTGLVTLVRTRAHERCEYCRMHDSLQGATFHVEHVRPRVEGGSDEESNRAWCCPSCNLHKSSRQNVVDPETQSIVPLFNPRSDYWQEHFEFRGFEIHGKTAIGRATISALLLNHPRRQFIRQAEALFALFPPM